MTVSTDLLMQLTAFETEYWHEVDRNWGRNAHTFYAEEGIFIIAEKTMTGRKAVADFYSWRKGRGDRTAPSGEQLPIG